MNAERPLVDLSELEFIGDGLLRPESVLIDAGGEIFVSDLECGFAQIGRPRIPLKNRPEGFVPNGLAIGRQGEFLIANPGGCGGVWKIDPEHVLHPFLLEHEGRELKNCNSVEVDELGRVWVSVSTRLSPRDLAFNAKANDGYVLLLDDKGARIVADGIGFTNECRVDPSRSWLYVNETFARRLTRFHIKEKNGSVELSDRETVCEFDDGDFPDGLAFDAQQGVWIACIISNRVLRITADGKSRTILDDSDPDLIAWVEARFGRGQLERSDIELGARRTLRNVSSIAFAGSDSKTVYLGTLGGSKIARFRSPIAGARSRPDRAALR